MTNTPKVTEAGVLTKLDVPLSEQARSEEELWRQRRQEFVQNSTDSPRERYDRYTGSTPRAEGVELEKVTTPTFDGWWCKPVGAGAETAVLYLHGGAFLVGSASGFCGLASQIAARTGLKVFVLEYPLAPEVQFPVAHDLVLSTYEWLSSQGVTELAVVGDSAGGNLSLASQASLLREPRKLPTPKTCVVFSPFVDLTLCGSTLSYPDPVIPMQLVLNSQTKYLGSASPSDPRASPLFDIPSGMPPIYIQVGADERLLDDSVRFAGAAVAKGNDVTLEIWEGMHHVFQLSVSELGSARKALDETADFLRRSFTRPGTAFQG